ncbi:hypothetical protein FKZ61_018300 [Litorilinea aerophila]|uniref:DUF5668 domain-containing protein n=1 Tax=Litorilinea aerophila TaxID=1204385 RepID=A0A540VBL7_9CHLR|nr:hypothetical protein [Litorilinea aerophila]MCC9078053.1 hypothetical protein [Litorilinea aerophila]GIV76006.1 MAG: hypothetical protein KatS3mg050_0400 [Litorilinea sp.]
MSDYRLNALFWSIGLILAGVILLLFNLQLLAAYEPTVQYVLAGGLALGGLGFMASHLSTRENWWRLIPGWTLLALALMVYLSTLEGIRRPVTAAFLFLGLALAFGHIYLLNRREHWWAIIPGGFMLVVSAVIALSAYVSRAETLGTVLFVGMGLVFFALYLLSERTRQWWALIPGSILVLFGFFVFTLDGGSENVAARWWPALLIIVGAGIGWHTLRRGRTRRERLTVHTAPRSPRTGSISSERGGTGGVLGEYTHPAPGASVEVLPDEETDSRP